MSEIITTLSCAISPPFARLDFTPHRSDFIFLEEEEHYLFNKLQHHNNENEQLWLQRS